jgi:hypothetical protein
MLRLQQEMQSAVEQVHRQYRRELVLYEPAKPPVPTHPAPRRG